MKDKKKEVSNLLTNMSIYGEFVCKRPITNWFWWIEKQTGRWISSAAISFITMDGIAYGYEKGSQRTRPPRVGVPGPEPLPEEPGAEEPLPQRETMWYLKCHFACHFYHVGPKPGFLSQNRGLVVELRKAWNSAFLRSGNPVPETMQFGTRLSGPEAWEFQRFAPLRKRLHYSFGERT